MKHLNFGTARYIKVEYTDEEGLTASYSLRIYNVNYKLDRSYQEVRACSEDEYIKLSFEVNDPTRRLINAARS